MGTREQKARCQDCFERVSEEQDVDIYKQREKSSFWIEMEFMTKDELIQHIKSTQCPECGSDNWRLRDETRM